MGKTTVSFAHFLLRLCFAFFSPLTALCANLQPEVQAEIDPFPATLSQLTPLSITSGEHLQHDDDQLSEGGRPERNAVVGHLLHLLRLRRALRVRHHPAADEGEDIQEAGDAAGKGRDVQDGHGGANRIPHCIPGEKDNTLLELYSRTNIHIPDFQHRLLGSLPLLTHLGHNLRRMHANYWCYNGILQVGDHSRLRTGGYV